MTLPLCLLIIYLAHRFGPRHRRTAMDIIRDHQLRRPVRAWEESK